MNYWGLYDNMLYYFTSIFLLSTMFIPFWVCGRRSPATLYMLPLWPFGVAVISSMPVGALK